MRIPEDGQIRADLRKVQKVTTAAGNIRFVAESTPDGHADRFWALALALHAGANPSAPIDYIPVPTHARGFDNRATNTDPDFHMPEPGGW